MIRDDGGDGWEAERRGVRRGADAVLDSLPDGIVMADVDGTVDFVNSRAAQLLGRSVQDVLGEPVAEAVPLLDGAGHSWWECIDPWGGLDIRTGHRERMLLLPGRGHVLVTMRYVRERPRGSVTRVVVALRDTDARRRAEAENAELISMVAHELRAPLASVKGFSSTLLKRWDRFTDEQKHLMIETIEADSERLARLIHELLDVSRLDTSRLRLAHRRVDLVSIVNRCIDRLVASGLDPTRFEVCVEAVEGDTGAWGDADRLDQIITNLMENAVRHGAGTVRVRVEPQDSGCSDAPAGRGPQWVVSVSDEGEGVRPEHYALVFNKFWHGSQRGSTGLGLYLVRGLVEAHGGSVSVGRAPEGGARFCFTVPRAVNGR